MARSLLLSLLLLVASTAFAQRSELLRIALQDDSVHAWQHGVFVDGNYQFDANSLYNELFLGVRRGDQLSRELRQRSLDAMTDKDRLGQVITGDLRVWGCDSLFGRGHWHSVFDLGYRDLLGAKYTRDLFELTFFGNKPFEDRTAELAPSALEWQRYQKLSWGILDERTLSWLTVGIVKGQYLQSIDLDRADVYTAPDGRRIDADIQGSYVRSDTANSDLGAFNGIGAAIDLRINRSTAFLSNGQGRSWWHVEVQDLGFIAWNDRSLQIDKDSTWEYQGILVENIFDLDAVVFGEEELLDTLGLNYSRRSFVRLLPFSIQAGLTFQPLADLTIAVAADHRYLPGYAPRVCLDGWWHWLPNARAGMLLSHGGFGGLRAGIGVEALIRDRFLVQLDSRNLIGPVTPTGRGIAASGAVGMLF